MTRPARRAALWWFAGAACAAAAPAPALGSGGDFAWARLNAVDGLVGGTDIWLSGAGLVHVREVGSATPDPAARTESRWEGRVSRATVGRLRAAVPAFLAAPEGFGRSGIPGEPYLRVDLERIDGSRIWRGKFDGDRRPGVDEVESILRDCAREVRAASAPRRIRHDPRWRP